MAKDSRSAGKKGEGLACKHLKKMNIRFWKKISGPDRVRLIFLPSIKKVFSVLLR